jgi:hypothetical protein
MSLVVLLITLLCNFSSCDNYSMTPIKWFALIVIGVIGGFSFNAYLVSPGFAPQAEIQAFNDNPPQCHGLSFPFLKISQPGAPIKRWCIGIVTNPQAL